jgi:hypothetical protein
MVFFLPPCYPLHTRDKISELCRCQKSIRGLQFNLNRLINTLQITTQWDRKYPPWHRWSWTMPLLLSRGKKITSTKKKQKGHKSLVLSFPFCFSATTRSSNSLDYEKRGTTLMRRKVITYALHENHCVSNTKKHTLVWMRMTRENTTSDEESKDKKETTRGIPTKDVSVWDSYK